MSVSAGVIIKYLMDLKILATINQLVDENIAKQVV